MVHNDILVNKGSHALCGLPEIRTVAHVSSVPDFTFEQLFKGPCSWVHFFWVAGKKLNLSYHNSKTILFPICPYYGNLH